MSGKVLPRRSKRVAHRAPLVASIADLSVDVSGDDIALSLNAVVGADTYQYRWGLTSDLSASEILDLPTNGDLPLLPGDTLLYFQVRGVSSVGRLGAWSNTDSVTSPATAPETGILYGPRLVRPVFGHPVVDYEWSLTGGGSVNEGDAISFSLTVNKHDIIPPSGEVVSVNFKGQATALPVGTFTQTIGQALIAAIAVTPGTSIGTGLNVLFDMTVWNGAFNFSRGTVNRPEEQGDLEGSLTIYSPSRGTIAAATASFTIVDTFVSTNPDLSDFTIDTAVTLGGVPTITVPYGTVSNTTIGTVTTVPGGGTINSVEFVTGGDEGGAFTLASLVLKAGATLDWETGGAETSSNLTWYGRAAYYVTLRCHGPNSSTVEKQFKIRPHFAIIEETGANGPSVNDGVGMTDAGWRNALSSTTSGGTVRFSPSVVRVFTTGSTESPMTASHRTFWGHKRVIFNRGAGIQINGANDLAFKHMAFRVGGDTTGYTYIDRDNLHLLKGQRITFFNCSFSWSIDEMISLIQRGRVRHVRFHRCLFAEALANAGHPDGNHAFGPLVYNNTMDIVFDKCVFLGFLQRSPMVAPARGVLIQNCVMGWYATNESQGAIFIKGSDPASLMASENGPNWQHSVIIRGNFFRPRNLAVKTNAVNVWNVVAGSEIYVSEGAKNDQNHFFTISGGVVTVGSDPVTVASNVHQFGETQAGCVRTYEPFGTDMDDELMETDTPTKCQLAIADILDNVGVRDDGNGNIVSGDSGLGKIDYDILKKFRADGTVRVQLGQFPNGPPPTAAVPGTETYVYDTSVPSVYYIAPTGNDTTGNGSLASPYATLPKLSAIIQPGDTIYLRGGTYDLNTNRGWFWNKSGTAGNLIKIWAYPGEVPIIDSTNCTAATSTYPGSAHAGGNGLQCANVSYNHFKGIRVRKAPMDGWQFIGENGGSCIGNIVELCVTSENGRNGEVGNGLVFYEHCDSNLILNCDSWGNRNSVGNGTNSDGFQLSTWGGNNNIIRYSRGYLNGDDGYDLVSLFNSQVHGGWLIDTCWAWKNGYLTDGTTATNGDGRGFKLGYVRGTSAGAPTIRNCLTWSNKVAGVDENDNDTQITVYNTTAWNNNRSNTGPTFYGNFQLNKTGAAAHVIRNCISFAPAHGLNAKTTGSTSDHNTWDLSITPTSGHFLSIDPTTAEGARESDGSLPVSDFLKLAASAPEINVGVDVGLPYLGAAPDLGAYERE